MKNPLHHPIVGYDSAGGVGTITFDRPPANAYELEFHRQFNEAIDAAGSDAGARVVVIRSAVSGFFSAGADIKVFARKRPSENREMVAKAQAALAKIQLSPKLYIACIEGHALGGGLEIALACDFRLGRAGDYRLGLPEVKLGLIPGNGGSQRLLRLVGLARALEPTASGDLIGPDEAHRLGLLNHLYPVKDYQNRTEAFAQRMASGPPLAMAAAKRAIQEGSDLKLSEGLALESQLAGSLLATDDAAEGLAAFQEKRKPSFQGC